MSTAWSQFNKKLKEHSVKMGVPISGQFELTARCNLSCKMCYVCKPAIDMEAKARELSAKDWITLAEKACDAGMLYLLLTGGEVFLRQDFKEIYEAVSMLGLRVGIYTNATMVTPDIAKLFGRIPPSRVEVTLYGASSETYARVCGNANGFEHAMRGIDLLLAEGVTLDLRTTVITDNTYDYDKIAEIADKRDVILKIVDYISPRRDECGTCSDGMRLSPLEMVRYEQHAQDIYSTRMKKSGQDSSIAEDKAHEKVFLQKGNHPFKCYAGRSEFWITWDGRMTPCGLMEGPVAFPLEQGFDTAWQELKQLCSLVPVCAECMQCSLKDICFTCPARLKNETGFFDKPAPYLCEFAKNKWECSQA